MCGTVLKEELTRLEKTPFVFLTFKREHVVQDKSRLEGTTEGTDCTESVRNFPTRS